MKKLVVFFYVAVFSLILLANNSMAANKPPLNELIVSTSGGEFSTIADALASLPDPNTTPVVIKVLPGTYQEDYLWMKSYVHLQGSGRDVTIIDDTTSSYNAIVIDYGITDVTISDFTILGAGTMIDHNGWQTPDQKVIIADNAFVGQGTTSTAIQMSYCSKNMVITNNIIRNTKHAFNIHACHASITNNTITGNGTGVGIQDNGEMNGVFSELFIFGNIISGYTDGIWTNGSSLAMIMNNVITENSGFGIKNGRGAPYISGNRITKNGKAGVYVGSYNNGGCTDSAISNNVISGNGTVDTQAGGIEGVYQTGGLMDCYTVINDNIVENNPYGIIWTTRNVDTAIKNNIVRKNVYAGLLSDGGQVSGNIATGNNTSQTSGQVEDMWVDSTTVLTHNVFDSINITPFTGSFNSKSDGTSW